jgi:hypothetical protein
LVKEGEAEGTDRGAAAFARGAVLAIAVPGDREAAFESGFAAPDVAGQDEVARRLGDAQGKAPSDREGIACEDGADGLGEPLRRRRRSHAVEGAGAPPDQPLPPPDDVVAPNRLDPADGGRHNKARHVVDAGLAGAPIEPEAPMARALGTEAKAVPGAGH